MSTLVRLKRYLRLAALRGKLPATHGKSEGRRLACEEMEPRRLLATIIPGVYGLGITTNQSEAYWLDVDTEHETLTPQHLGTLYKSATTKASPARDIAILPGNPGGDFFDVYGDSFPSVLRRSDIDVFGAGRDPDKIIVSNVNQLYGAAYTATQAGVTTWVYPKPQTFALEWSPAYGGNEPILWGAGNILYEVPAYPGYNEVHRAVFQIDTGAATPGKITQIYNLDFLGNNVSGDIAFDFASHMYLSLVGGDILELDLAASPITHVLHNLPAGSPSFTGLLPLEFDAQGEATSLIGFSGDRKYYEVDLITNTAIQRGTLEHSDPNLLDAAELVWGASLGYETPIQKTVSGVVNENNVPPRMGQLWYELTAGDNGQIRAALSDGGTAGTALKLYDSLEGNPAAEGHLEVSAQVNPGQTLWLHAENLAFGETADLQFTMTTEYDVEPDKIGIRHDSSFLLDADGNGLWNPDNDLRQTFGDPADTPIVGDWNGDGYDEVGVHRGNQFLLDSNGNGSWEAGVDLMYTWGLAGDTPLPGDWNNDGRDEIGLRRGNQFILDVDGNGTWTPGVDRAFNWGLNSDTPLVGDWNGDGFDEVGLRRGDQFILDVDGNGTWTAGVDRSHTWGLASDTPIAGDWNGDGSDEIGLRSGAKFTLDYDDNGAWTPDIDRVHWFGGSTDIPVIGVWRSFADDKVGLRRGNQFILDVDGSGGWTPGDRAFNWGINSDTPLVGDWNGDGYDEIGLRRGNQFILDVDGSGGWTTGDRAFYFGVASDIPLVGDFNGDGSDTIGLRRGNQFILDVDGSGGWTTGDRAFFFGVASDIPLVGDWSGDGSDAIGLRRGSQFILDVDGSGGWTTGDRAFNWGLSSDTPLVGDWNAVGSDAIGLRRGSQFILDVDGNGRWTTGVDRAFNWGVASDKPLVGNWAAAAPLLAAVGPARIDSEAETLTAAAVTPILAQAIDAYSALPLSARQQTLLGQLTVRVDDLAGARLGETLGTTITLDGNAAGYGWFVDATPWEDSEFLRAAGQRDLTARPNGPATSRMDLVTVVRHEIGHVLGYEHVEGGVMDELLPLATRRDLDIGAVDRIFADL